MSDDPPVAVTFFKNYAAQSKREEPYTVAALACRIYAVTADAKGKLPWLKLARFGDRRTDKNSLRNDANVLACSGIEADYDAGKVPIADAIALLRQAGIRSIVYTSPSYTANFPKWRVLCPFSKELPPKERARMLGRLAGLFARFGAEFASESWTLSQSYYFGSVKHNPAHQVVDVDGTPIDLHAALDATAKGKPDTERRGEVNGHQHSGPVDDAALRAQIVTGNSFHTASVRLVGKWAQQGVSLLDAQKRLEQLFDDVFPPDRDARWQQRRDDIPRIMRGIYGSEAGKQDARANASGWGEPVDCFAPVNTDPVDVTEDEAPAALWPYVDDTAGRLGVARSSVLLACLVACAAVIDDSFRLQPKRHDDTWTERPRLWGAIVGPPSILKTPVIAAATKPLDRLERDARKRWQDDVRRWETAQKDAAARGGKFTDPRPRRPRYVVESATVEALQEVLRDDREARFTAPARKVLVRQDELAEFIANLDRYTNGRGAGDRGAYLRLYNGGCYTVDRIGRGSFTASNWSGCLLGGIQPEPIQRIARQAVDDGLLQRFVYDVPAPADADGADRAPDRRAIERYHRLIPALGALHPGRTADGGVETVVMAADAHTHRAAVANVARGVCDTCDISPRMQAAFGKWPGLFARLCLVFHMIEIADARAAGEAGPPIDVVSAATAARVARYMRRVLLPHLLRADAVMFATAQTGHAKWIAGHILAHALERITVRDVVRAYGALRAPEQRRELESVMASLVGIGWLDPEPLSNPLNPVMAWRVNPAVHTLYADRAGLERRERAERQRQAIAARTERAAA